MSEMTRTFTENRQKLIDFLLDQYRINLLEDRSEEEALSVYILYPAIRKINNNFDDADLNIQLKFLQRDGLVNDITFYDSGEGYDQDTGETVAFLVKLADDFENRTSSRQVKLSDYKIIFDDDKAQIKFGDKICQLPQHKNEHFFCRILFTVSPGEPLDWSYIFDEMNDFIQKPQGRKPKKDKKSIHDTLYALNKRMKEIFNTEDSLFSASNGSIRRNF